MHHLHCLVSSLLRRLNASRLLSSSQNLVRKALYFNYNRYKALGEHAFQNDEPILRRHVSEFFWLDSMVQTYTTRKLRLVKHTASTLSGKS